MELNFNTTEGYLKSAQDLYEWGLTFSHPSTKGWPLVDSPVVPLCVILYLLMVWSGPKIMKNRKAFDLRWALIPYNIGLALLSGFIALRLFVASIQLNYSYICHPCRGAHNPEELALIYVGWLYYVSKIIELADTLFFILKKKDQQLTFLHVYHHASMLVFTWIGIKWVPCGSAFVPVLLNSAVHLVMYTYYGLSALGPKVAKYLWWKKYLTIMQLTQFTIGLLLTINGLIINCDFPLWMHYASIGYMLSYIVLFGRFYIKAYQEKGSKVFYGIDTGCGQGMFDEKGKLITYTSAGMQRDAQETKKGK